MEELQAAQSALEKAKAAGDTQAASDIEKYITQLQSSEELSKATSALEKAKAANDTQAVSDLEGYISQLGSSPAQPQKSLFEKITDPFSFGADQQLESYADTLDMLGADGVSKQFRGALEGPSNYTPANFMNPDGAWYDFNWSEAPKALAETSSSMATSIAPIIGGAATGNPLLLAGGIGLSGAHAASETFGPVIKERMRRKGTSEPDGGDYLMGASAAGSNAILNIVGGAGTQPFRKLAANKALNTIKKTGAYVPRPSVVSQLSNAAAKTGREGVTSGLEDTVQQFYETFATDPNTPFPTIDPKRSLGAGMLGAGARAMMPDVSVGVPKALTYDAVINRLAKRDPIPVDKKRPYLEGEIKASRGRVANALQEASRGTYSTLKSGKENRYQNEALVEGLNNVHTDNSGNFVETWRSLKPELTKDIDPNTPEGAKELGRLRSIFNKARSKRKTTIPQQDIDYVARKVAHLDLGRQLINSMYDSNTITKLANKDPVGGISPYLEFLNPLNADKGLKGAINKAVGGTSAIGTGGLSWLGYGLARGIDSKAGSRYQIDKFVRDWKGEADIDPSGLESFSGLQMAEALAKADKARRTTNVYPDSDAIYKSALSNKEAITPEWLAENRSSLSPSHFRTLTGIRDATLAAQKREADRTKSKAEKDREKARFNRERRLDKQLNASLRAAEIGIKADEAAERMRELRKVVDDKLARADDRAKAQKDLNDLRTLREDLQKEFTDLLSEEALTPEMVAQHRDTLTASQYKSWKAKADKASAPPKLSEGLKARNEMSKKAKEAQDQTAKELAQSAQLLSQAALKVEQAVSKPITVELPNAPQFNDPSPYASQSTVGPDADLDNPAGFYRAKGDIVSHENKVLEVADALPDGLLKTVMEETIGLFRNYAKSDQKKRLEVLNQAEKTLKSNPDITDAEIELFKQELKWLRLRFADKATTKMFEDVTNEAESKFDPLPEDVPF